MRDLLLTGRLFPLQLNGKVRPICIIDTAYKLAALYVMSLIDVEFDTIQRGTGTKGGVEVAVHEIQARLEQSPNHIVLSTDVANAFNSRHRSHIEEALQDNPADAPLLRLFQWTYGKSIKLLIHKGGKLMKEVSCEEGIMQGEPTASYCYNRSMQKIYKACVEGLSDVWAIAIHDDLTFVGLPSSVLIAYKRYAALMKKDGMALQPSKCRVLVPSVDDSDDVDDEIRAMCDENKFALHVSSMPLLGARVGNITDGDTRQWLKEKVQSHKQLFSALLSKNIPKQVSLLLLRSCGLPLLNFSLAYYHHQ